MEEIRYELNPNSFEVIDEAIEEQYDQYVSGGGHKRNKYYSKLVKTKQIPLKNGERDTIIKWIYDTNLVQWYTTYLMRKNIDNPDVEDCIQEIFTFLCEKKQEDWDRIYQQGFYAVSAYVSGLIHRQIRSDSSKIYRKYGKYNENVVLKDEEFWTNYEENR